MPKLLDWTTEMIEVPCTCFTACGAIHRQATGRKVLTYVFDPGEPTPDMEWVTPAYIDATQFVLPWLSNTVDEEEDAGHEEANP